MPYRDLREFLARLELEGELARVETPVNLKYEIGAICREVLSAHGPAVLFERPGDSAFPLVAGLVSTRRRYAMALETQPQSLLAEWSERVGRSLPPVVVSTGPCKENVIAGDDVDLFKLPIPVWNEMDGGPYITLPIQITRNPESGEGNAAIYRCQVHDKRTLGLLAAPYRDLARQRSKTAARGEPFPVAIAIGVEPTIVIAAASPFPYGTDELAMAGALRGEPIEVVPCETIPLTVPAHAEIVLEGEIPADVTREEGLFGDFSGYYGIKNQCPIIQLKCITFRNSAIYSASYIGKPPDDATVLGAVAMEAEVMRSVALPGIQRVHVTEGSCGAFNAIVSVKKPFEGYGKMVGMCLLGNLAGRRMKTLIVVDEDIDPFNPTEVEWAVSTRVQPDRDVEIIRDVTGIALDPSLPLSERLSGNSLTSKMIIDATIKNAAEFEKPCAPDQDTWKYVRENWARYGIKLDRRPE